MDKVKKFKSKVEKVKNSLIAKAKRKGTYENFGQNEVRMLQESIDNIYTTEGREMLKAVDIFNEWAMTYNG